ncbi:MAG: DNA adenine methylase [Elusimicrobiota bacterium]|jgi:adenine-specific DNA-methyltransferase|nr:DNA adenine methylase [Elusimicrobiota bacterium]
MYKLHNRRYIGNKFKLIGFILDVLKKEKVVFNSCADLFAGTGVVSEYFLSQNKHVFINDALYSNYVFYNAWLSNGKYNEIKINDLLAYYNSSKDYIFDNYFSDNFSGTYFSYDNAKKIGSIRQHLESIKSKLTKREFFIVLASLLYSIDQIANTVGHYESFLSSNPTEKPLVLKMLDITRYANTPIITCEDANKLAKDIEVDLIYIDPPYNSRQYINFYHILENLALWQKPQVFGKTLKMDRTGKKSQYSKANAVNVLKQLLCNVKTKYILLSYNNTYAAKSIASINKIKTEDIYDILYSLGSVKKYEANYRFFNSGKTHLEKHKEFLFLGKLK